MLRGCIFTSRNCWTFVITLSFLLPLRVIGVNVSIPDTQELKGSEIEIPINIDNSAGVAGFQFTVSYDDSVLEITGVSAGSLTSGWTLTPNTNNPGEIRIVGTDNSLAGLPGDSGSLVLLKFSVTGTCGATTTLSFTYGKLSDSEGREIDSDYSGGTFTVKCQQVATPTFSPDNRTFCDPFDVIISCSTDGATIYYTTDGSEPDENSSQYTEPIHITDTTTIKAKAYKADMRPSEIATAVFESQCNGQLQFDYSTYSVREGDGSATITVTRTDGSDGEVTVDYATSDGTATEGSDYTATATSGTLTFADGETSKTFTIPIIDDGELEKDETINLTLTSPTGGATLGTQTTAILKIVDNDKPILEVKPPHQNVGCQFGTTKFVVSNTGTGDMYWKAKVIEGIEDDDWLRITSGDSGTNAGTITVEFDVNTSTEARTAKIRVTADGATGSPVEVTVTQAGCNQYLLKVTTDGQGSVTLNPPGGVYNEDSLVKINAVPEKCWQFDHWEGDVPEGQEQNKPLTIKMDSNKTITAVFVPSTNPCCNPALLVILAIGLGFMMLGGVRYKE